MNKQKGFTLIELLVVIAIIGILASVVLAALSSARTKGQSAAVQSELANMRAQAELYYATNGNYGTGYTSANLVTLAGATVLPTISCSTDVTLGGTSMFVTGAASNVGTLGTLIKGACNSGSTAIVAAVNAATPAKAWALEATAPSPNTSYCVDSSGTSKAYTSSSPGSFLAGPVCP